MVKIHMMKAQEGDFIWLSYGDMEKEHHLLIDGGVKDCRERYADVVRSISAKGESIEKQAYLMVWNMRLKEKLSGLWI